MSSTLEFEGKSVEEAITKACDTLKLEKNKIKHEVISYGSTGIFGLVGAKKAVIRVSMPKVEAAGTENNAESKEMPKKNTPKPKINSKGEHEVEAYKPSPEHAIMPDLDPEDLAPADDMAVDIDVIPEEDIAAVSVDKTETAEENRPIVSAPVLEIKTDEGSEPVVIPDSVIESGQRVLQHIIDTITEDTSVSVKQKSSRIEFAVTGGNSAILIGKRGQTLSAIQYLVEKVINKQSDVRVQVEVDVEGYLDTRRESLLNLARRLSLKAIKTGKPITVGQMNAHDRKTIHLALKRDGSVRTKSLGEGYYKKLVIFPKKRNNKKRAPKKQQAQVQV
ncbi:MAG: Jag N-terminal domain-containing protein [Desulfobacterales bacterium]|nr:Jag N-terminal domain-containing protein [Desulfobacterales bacterium]